MGYVCLPSIQSQSFVPLQDKYRFSLPCIFSPTFVPFPFFPICFFFCLFPLSLSSVPLGADKSLLRTWGFWTNYISLYPWVFKLLWIDHFNVQEKFKGLTENLGKRNVWQVKCRRDNANFTWYWPLVPLGFKKAFQRKCSKRKHHSAPHSCMYFFHC